MKIEKIALRNFRTHAEYELELSPLTIIVGQNGTGKSTLLHAIEWCLTGKCAVLNERDKGALSTMTGEGPRAEHCSVTLDTDKGRVERYLGGVDLSWMPRQPKAREAQGEIEKRFAFRSDAARLALSGSFFRLDSKTQKSLLSELLQLSITQEAVIAELDVQGKATGLPLLQSAQKVVGRLTDFEGGYKAAYDHRTGVKRVLKELTAQAAGLEEDEVFVPDGAIDSLRSRRKELTDELAQLNQERGRLSAVASERARRERDILQYSARRDEAIPVPVEVVDYQTDIARLREELDADNAGWGELGRMKSEADAAKRELEKLQSEVVSASVCPWTTGMICHGAEGRVRDAKEKLEAQSAKLQAIQERVARQKELVSSFRPSATVRAELASLVGRNEVQESAVRAYERDAKIHESAARIVAEATARLESLPDPAPEIARIDAYLPGLSDTLQAIQVQLDTYQAEKLQREQRAALRARLAKAESDVDLAEHLVAFYEPGGFQANHLAAQLDPIVEQLNGILANWGMECQYQNLTLLVRTMDGPWCEYKDLADSAQIIVSLAHQAVFAILSQVGLVVVDRVESLDGANQAFLLQAASDILQTPGVDHVILIGVRMQEPRGLVQCDYSWQVMTSKEVDNA